jgi:catechol 2,3-dioxygenase
MSPPALKPLPGAAVPIDSRVRIGHGHLKVADLDRSLRFYCGVLGFELMQRIGDEAAFLSAGGYHHHLGLNTWDSRGGSRPAPNATGLYHIAILYPDRAALAEAMRRLHQAGVELTGASDHGVSEALYLDDPDGNGLELYWDRQPHDWPRHDDGTLAMYTRRLDVAALLSEAEATSQNYSPASPPASQDVSDPPS